ncbi:Tyrosine recombinase XerC [termite gut metagenome]|uniref:Tyrosine recombinase XerC n=1 Tax=termite gut metagenome TaxID=433724 RepID=A0A5J4QFL5_9ZZZZ
MKTNTDFAKLLSKFLSRYLPHERNMSPNTILSYRDTFVQFISYMRGEQKIRIEKLTLDKITKDAVLGFLAWVQNERNCGIATRNYRLAAIHSFILYLQYEDIVHLSQWQKILSIKAMKSEEKSINYLTVDALKLLLQQPDTTTSKGRRNLALLALMYDT